MFFDTGTGLQLAVAFGLLIGGLAAGLALGRGGSRARARIRELELEVRVEREEHAAYRDGVAKHFAGTSDLFRDLTHQYTALYAHLAEGARDLCPDRVPALGRGLGEPPRIAERPQEPDPLGPEDPQDSDASIEALTREVAGKE
jgi:uncharacterized membrane-anchored protein YhcB (DUF1043 family)